MRMVLGQRLAWWLGAATGRAVGVLDYPRRALRRRRARRPDARGRARTLSVSIHDAPPPERFVAADVAAQEGLDALGRTLSDPDPHVRLRALDVICEFSQGRAAGLLIGMLHDPDPTVRTAAAYATTRVGGREAVFSLIHALEDPDASVRDAAATAVGQLTGTPVDRAALGDPPAARRLVEGLIAWWKEERIAQLARSDAGEPAPRAPKPEATP